MSSPFEDTVRRITKRLLGARWENPFGPDVDVCMFGGKMFVLWGGPVEQITVKCDPDEALSLCGTHCEIVPGYHMNKKHWITIRPGIDSGLLEDLIVDSYWLVGQGIPLKRRPVMGLQDEE